jgi:hypothetical protein
MDGDRERTRSRRVDGEDSKEGDDVIAVGDHLALLVSAGAAALHPEHRIDLGRLGLNPETVEGAKTRSIPSADLHRYVGPKVRQLVTTAFLVDLETEEPTDFYRVKVCPRSHRRAPATRPRRIDGEERTVRVHPGT